MPTLDNKIFIKILSLNDMADKLIDHEQFSEAIKVYQKAWNTLPEPRQLWDAGLWIKVGQAECFLAQLDYNSARAKLLEAMLCTGAVNNPLVHFLLGVCCFELGDMDCAKNELSIAYEIEGDKLFQEGDEAYEHFLKAGNH